MIPIDFSGSHAMVFGGTTGINFHIALAFAKCGANVTVVSRSAQNVETAVETLKRFGHGVHGAIADVRDYEAVGSVVRDAVTKFGQVDTLISGAAGNFLCEAAEMSPNGFRAVMEIDLFESIRFRRGLWMEPRDSASSWRPQGRIGISHRTASHSSALLQRKISQILPCS